MRFIDQIDGALEVRWTWLPYWIAINPVLVREVEEEVFDLAKLNAATNSDADMDALHKKVCEILARKMPAFKGLDRFLLALSEVSVGSD